MVSLPSWFELPARHTLRSHQREQLGSSLEGATVRPWACQGMPYSLAGIAKALTIYLRYLSFPFEFPYRDCSPIKSGPVLISGLQDTSNTCVNWSRISLRIPVKSTSALGLAHMGALYRLPLISPVRRRDSPRKHRPSLLIGRDNNPFVHRRQLVECAL